MQNNDILTFLGFFAAGLLVNLTPCVYPMLTVSASLFKPRQGSHESLRHSFAKALAYFLGIVLMYSALGYAAASGGQFFGAALQNSWVLGVVALMMFALGLSMFGVYQLSLPVDLLNKVASWRKANYLGLFFSGLLVGVFAAPCIGPPVIALLATVADKGSPVFGLSAFFVFACGLGLPYLLLGTFSTLINKLPKGGNWLLWVEHSFGIVLFGFAAFYFSLSLSLSQVTPWVWPLTLVLGGIYIGFIEHHRGERKLLVNLKHATAAMAIFVGLVLIAGHLNVQKEKITWQLYSAQAVTQAINEGKPVVIDFYADWCINCHELEAMVFSNKKVVEKAKAFITLRVDATNTGDPKVDALISQYDLIGLPTIILLDKKGQEVKKLRVEGVISAAKFIKRLEDLEKI